MAAKSGGEARRIPHWSSADTGKISNIQQSLYWSVFGVARCKCRRHWMIDGCDGVHAWAHSGVTAPWQWRTVSATQQTTFKSSRVNDTTSYKKKTTLCNDRVNELESMQLHATMMIIIATMKMNPVESKLQLNWGLRKQVMCDGTFCQSYVFCNPLGNGILKRRPLSSSLTGGACEHMCISIISCSSKPPNPWS